MRVTNKLNLPQAFVSAVTTMPHNAEGCYSATTLYKGVLETVLAKRHWDEIVVDAADSVWAVFGSAVHALLEKERDSNLHEKKFSTCVSNSIVTGQVDSYDEANGIIYDWKTASANKVLFDDFNDWTSQGLTYAWLMARNGIKARHCVFVALLKDHSKTKAQFDANYPQSPVCIYQFDVTAEKLEKHGEWMADKVAMLEAAEKLPDDDIPACTAEERWADGEKWAVMKNGRKSAVKLFDDEASAKKYAAELSSAHYVEHRPAVSRKCENYCNVKQWCSFYRQSHREG